MAQASLNRTRSIYVTEGETDARALKIASSRQDTPIDFYCINEIDTSKSFRPSLYGWNKSRVVALINSEKLEDVAGKNLFGLIDRDFDFHRKHQLSFNGLVYTYGSSLFVLNFKRERLLWFYETMFTLEPTNIFLDEFEDFSRRYFSFLLQWREKVSDIAPPAISKYVRNCSKGFDWAGYAEAVQSKSKGQFAISAELDHRCIGDIAKNIFEHTSIEYLFRLSKRDNLLPSNLDLTAFQRFWLAGYQVAIDECPTWSEIREAC